MQAFLRNHLVAFSLVLISLSNTHCSGKLFSSETVSGSAQIRSKQAADADKAQRMEEYLDRNMTDEMSKVLESIASTSGDEPMQIAGYNFENVSTILYDSIDFFQTAGLDSMTFRDMLSELDIDPKAASLISLDESMDLMSRYSIDYPNYMRSLREDAGESEFELAAYGLLEADANKVPWYEDPRTIDLQRQAAYAIWESQMPVGEDPKGAAAASMSGSTAMRNMKAAQEVKWAKATPEQRQQACRQGGPCWKPVAHPSATELWHR